MLFFSRSLEVKKHVVVSAGCGHHCKYKSKTIFLEFPDFAISEWRARISHTWHSDGSGCFWRWSQQSGNCSSHETSLDNSHFLMVVLVSGKPWTHAYFLTSWCNCLFFVIYTNAISLWNADKKRSGGIFFLLSASCVIKRPRTRQARGKTLITLMPTLSEGPKHNCRKGRKINRFENCFVWHGWDINVDILRVWVLVNSD